jgi:transposase InsO family protein
MIVTLHTDKLTTLAELQAFVEGNPATAFTAATRDEAYDCIADTLHRFHYAHLGKADKGVVIRYLGLVTGYSRQQLSRLFGQFRDTRQVKDRRGAPAKPFPRRYTDEDTRLLAELDVLHHTPSGPAVRKLAERAFQVFGDARFERLAGISNGHLYNLRRGAGYQRLRTVQDKTRPVRSAIGERRKPSPQGRPGWLRIDSVHQGDLDGIKGLYLINAVDEVTQFQVVGAVERINGTFLLPLLERLLQAFPFVIRGFHADNGSEYINHQVASLLNRLQVEEFTKSRARQCNDNALVESKNGSVVRKHLGYSHIPGRFAQRVNAFTFDILSPYLNYHRPCFFPEEYLDAKGRLRKRYRYEHMMTPYDKFKALPEADQYLRPGLSFTELDAEALRFSDNEAARRLNEARTELFRTIHKAQTPAA